MSRRLLITAGPTHEPVDAVRYLANRSSGRLGVALAEAAGHRRWPVTLLLGPTPLDPPEGSQVTVHRFQTAEELGGRLRELWPEHDVLLMAAAVADYRPREADLSSKLPRGDALTLELEPTEDLLAGLAEGTRPDQTLIGFALEPEARLATSARAKLDAKGVDAIIANPLTTMSSPTITATVFTRGGTTLRPPPELPKAEFAAWLLDHLDRIIAAAGKTVPQ